MNFFRGIIYYFILGNKSIGMQSPCTTVWMGRDWGMYQSLNTRCVLDESGTDEVECRRKVSSKRKVADGVGSLVNARNL